MCFYQQALCVEIKCNDYFDVHIKIAIVIDLNCALFPSQNECKQEQDLPGFFPCGIWLQAWGAVRIYIENDELRGIVKRFICGRGWRDCKAAEDTSGGSDRWAIL